MNTVVPETRVTLDTRLFCENVIVLALKITNNLLESKLVVDVVTKSRRVDDGERDADTVFLKL